MKKEFEVSKITITRYITASGEDSIEVDCSENLTLLELLGLLSFAKATVISDADMNSEE